MKICICGDIFPEKSIQGAMIASDASALVGEKLLSRLREADLAVANLETPLTDEPDGIVKNGPVLSAPTACVKGLKPLGLKAVTLANNHIMDCGPRGLSDTIKALDNENISFFGAGKNLDSAAESFVFEKDGLRVGIYACAENEFSIAEKELPGANPFDPYLSCEHIRALKMRCHRVLVLLHGGKEYYRYPSPELQKQCRRMIFSGADLVVCQHSHCVGCKEDYQGGTIVYGQGNFLFPGPNDAFWDNGLLIEWEFDSNENKVDYIPFNSGESGICEAEGERRDALLDAFLKRSEQAADPMFVKRNYQDFSKSFLENYISAIFGYSKWERRWDRYVFKGKLFEKKLNKARALALLNFIDCEAHRELITEGLRQFIDSY